MPVVSFLRHGATAWNEEGRMQGRRDIALSLSGRNDVAGWSLPADIPQPIDWVASPLLRAVETAQLLAGSAPRIEPALTEMDWGAWEGYSLAELQTRFGRRIRTKRKSRARLPSARRGKSARRRRARRALAGVGRRAGRFDRRGDAQRRAARAARARDRLGHARQAARQAAARDAAPVHAGARTAANDRRVQRAAVPRRSVRQ